MSKSVVTLSFNPPALRWILLLPALLALLGAWFAVRWYVGNTIAENASAANESGFEMAQMAARWAPGDPLTHWRLGFFQEKNFSAENLAAAVREYELAVQAAPYDYRYWMELGRALEATGDYDGGEKALRRAIELAPAYSHPLWYYGNALLRRGRVDDAFAQLSRAADVDALMQPQVFALATQVFGDNLDKIIAALPSPAVRIQFALSLIKAKQFDQAVQVLQSVSAKDRQSQTALTDDVMNALFAKRQFRAALSILRELEPDASQLPTPEQVWNGGFENNVPPADPKPFHWVINSRPQAQLLIDSRAHSGNRSLRIVFNAPNKLDSIGVTQRIIVEPDTAYRIQFYQRTEKLVSGVTPIITITDDANGGLLASSQPAQSGTNDWQLVTLDFKTPLKTDGISLGFARSPCIDDPEVCPIFGSIWYDDFNLQRISGPRASGRAAGNSKR